MHPFEQHLLKSWSPDNWSDLTILIGVSGGADSVALLRGLVAIRVSGPGSIVVAHFNHGLRPTAAERDMAFVEQLASDLNLDCVVGVADLPLNRATLADGIEAYARSARHDFLESTALRIGARHIVTAHTADDQAETVLFRIIRGTGIAGLCGIPRSRSVNGNCSWIRPLLQVRRRDIEEYLTDHGHPFCNDETNRDLKIIRNRIRHELLPTMCHQYHTGAVDSILRLAESANEVIGELQALSQKVLAQSTILRTPEEAVLNWISLRENSDFLIRESLRRLWMEQRWPLQAVTREHWLRLLSELRQESRNYRSQFPAGVEITRADSRITIRASKN